MLREGPYTLFSGEESPFYFDLKPLLNDPETLTMITSLILERLPQETTAVGGLSDGAIPISTSLILMNERTQTIPSPLKGFWVRQEPKPHGLPGLIAGRIDDDDAVVIVDDVTTTGSSVLDAIEGLAPTGARVLKVVTVLDRSEGARTTLQERNLRLEALFTLADFPEL